MTCRLQSALCLLIAGPLLVLGVGPDLASAAPGPLDEAKLAGREAESFPPADEDYFKLMDNVLYREAGVWRGRQVSDRQFALAA
jgi:hypothetical protein